MNLSTMWGSLLPSARLTTKSKAMTAMRFYRCFLVLACLALIMAAIEPAARVAGWVPAPGSAQSPIKPDKPKKSRPRPEMPLTQPPQAPPGGTVYDSQPPVRDSEIASFVELLPRFRVWARQNGEEAHPVLTRDGRPDFMYSPQAAQWVREHHFDAARFFCIMGKMAAGLVIVEEGNDFKGTRPRDMPPVDSSELELVRKHLGELLNAGGAPAPLR